MRSAGAFRFPLTIFLSAFLLFQVQPLMGRYMLPRFGGGPAVWTACMLFFQALLLAGYAYAHGLGHLRDTRRQATLHCVLLALSLLFLPLRPRFDAGTSLGDPSLRIVLLLAATVGGPYFLLSATGPLLQKWFTLSRPGQSPWPLYALSNAGSFLALLSYPFLVEPYLRLRVQSGLWSSLYLLFVAICALTALRLRPAAVSEPETESTIPGLGLMLFWLALSAAGSTLLLATTNLVSQEIAVNPFLWVAPLSIYLLTFILAFERDRWYVRPFFAVASGIAAPIACAVMAATVAFSVPRQLAVYAITLFAVCMLCHGELALSRPSPRYLTRFYLLIAAGGAVGGGFVALLAPRIFTEYGEYPICLGFACLLGFAGYLRTGAYARWTTGNFAIRIPLMALLMGGITAITAFVINLDHAGVERWRNFYGVLRVAESQDARGPLRQLTHGSIRHGFQYRRSPDDTWPTSYYGPHSGVGVCLKALEGAPRRVAVIGLGTGTLAAWGRAGDTFRFYEINPIVETVARTRFTYLAHSAATIQVVLGDARVRMEREFLSGHSQDFDLIAVDAFSSDSIPIHLLTAECAGLYRRRLAPGGALLLHISNRSLNLEPVARGLSNYLRWKGGLFIAPADSTTGESASTWVALAPDPAFLRKRAVAAEVFGWTLNGPAPVLWTDDFASLWHVLRF